MTMKERSLFWRCEEMRSLVWGCERAIPAVSYANAVGEVVTAIMVKLK
ncbi:MAG: hypothetical protein ACKO9I_22195 [Sphaerospermopsis kisseleviana]|nr:hypothetical protein [Sphaerospermopsis reniformis]